MDAPSPIRLVIADDHPMTLMGLSMLFGNDPEFAVVAEASDGEEALRAVRDIRPDLLLLDVNLPRVDGFDVLKTLHGESLACRTLLYTYCMDDDRLLEAMNWGVRGVVLKTMPPTLLVQAVKKVHAGGLWLEIGSVGRVLERDAARLKVRDLLTDREIELVKAIAVGSRNKTVAARLNIQEGTVRIHLHNIYRKLGLSGRGELIAYAQRNGLT
ncbi:MULTISPECIES: response regulator [Methylomonas]|uniref:DNA-binding response regulator n=1 Tax=Methylomonas koyamae TaxID=702114 RepID=A0A177PFC0_9GAMM|nr:MULTISPECIES: response regulator transcription factor [Methylomonas]OAI29028.1 hypothetical protein A1355_17140 [Methylomonas koyamae]OHX35490.1 hypothetical protein BJL95_14705 [Methylomonas sp. LWB]